MNLQIRKVKIELLTEMLGTVPGSKAVYTDYIESKKPDEMKADIEAETVMENFENKGHTGFHSDANGLFVYDYFIKGMIKNAGNVLKDSVGVKNLRSKLTDFLFVFPRRIYLGKDKADDMLERPLRAQTMQGPRVTLARSDLIEAGTTLEFEIKFLPHKEIDDKIIQELLSYGELQGLGQFRNGGYGRFRVVSYEAVNGMVSNAPVADAPKKRGPKPKQ